MKRFWQMLLISVLLLGILGLSTACGLFTAFLEPKTSDMGDAPVPAPVAREEAKMEGSMARYDTGFAWIPPSGPEPNWNTEEYSNIEDNRFLTVAANPFSTFGADVDTAGYSHVRRYLLQSQMLPPQDAVRVEELINYFRYDYPEPEGDEPLSVSMEWTDTPWNPDTKLFSVGLQAKKVDNEKRQPANLVFLIDVSGSMDTPDKLPLVQEAFRLLTENLSDQDRVSIVTYAGYSSVACEGMSGTDREKILNVLDGLMAGGGTHGSEGIETAYQLAEKYKIPGGSNRVILATDGDLNIGVTSEGDLVKLIEEKKAGGVFLTVLGFGQGNIKDNKMEALADKGNGQYAVIDNIFEARRVLVEEMGAQLNLIARDVKLQVEFNPALVKAYRLIGYENRLMAAEDFADDSKDGGEMGSGHRVTALYEIVLKDSPMEVEAPSGRYQQAPTADQADQADQTEEDGQNSSVEKTDAPNAANESSEIGKNEWLTVNIRYQAPEGGESKLSVHPFVPGEAGEISDNLKLASSVAAFGMKLRKSEFLGTYSYEDILRTLRSLQSQDASVDELIYLVGTAEKLTQDK